MAYAINNDMSLLNGQFYKMRVKILLFGALSIIM